MVRYLKEEISLGDGVWFETSSWSPQGEYLVREIYPHIFTEDTQTWVGVDIPVMLLSKRGAEYALGYETYPHEAWLIETEQRHDGTWAKSRTRLTGLEYQQGSAEEHLEDYLPPRMVEAWPHI